MLKLKDSLLSYFQVLLCLPEQWRRRSHDALVQMISFFFTHFSIEHKVAIYKSFHGFSNTPDLQAFDILVRFDQDLTFFVLWWSIYDIRLEMQKYIVHFSQSVISRLYSTEDSADGEVSASFCLQLTIEF